MGGKEGILGAQQAVPAHQDPQPSCRASPIMSQCLPHQGSSTYPLSRGASITPGTLRTILAWVPRIPLPGRAQWSEGTVLDQACTRVDSAGAVWFRGGMRGKVSK